MMVKKNPIPNRTECALCGRLKEEGKRYNRHHIDYDRDITIILCYTCHSLVHGRSFCRMRNLWEYKYGKDKGFYKLCKAFIKVYHEALPFSG